ncbi:MAG: hypothetical protein HC869_24470 [Rhodospirillales bacterium]|nr:hypothetical protein [Rhodospirillales bacterium]
MRSLGYCALVHALDPATFTAMSVRKMRTGLPWYRAPMVGGNQKRAGLFVLGPRGDESRRRAASAAEDPLLDVVVLPHEKLIGIAGRVPALRRIVTTTRFAGPFASGNLPAPLSSTFALVSHASWNGKSSQYLSLMKAGSTTSRTTAGKEEETLRTPLRTALTQLVLAGWPRTRIMHTVTEELRQRLREKGIEA